MIKSRVMRWGVHKYIKIMAGKPEGKWPLRSRTYRWDNIETNLREIWCNWVDWIHLAQGRDRSWALVNMKINPSFDKRRGISWLAELLSTSEERLFSMELVLIYGPADPEENSLIDVS
jgi:hypothetical protein